MQRPMITTGPHSVRATPQFVDLCREYAQHYIRCAQEKIEEYRSRTSPRRSDGLRAITEDDVVVLDARREIARATVVHEALDVLRGELARYCDLNFETWAAVLRQSRIELGLARIEDSPELRLVVTLAIGALKAQNPKFSEEKFIKYINEGGSK
jgi:hypothetical protein